MNRITTTIFLSFLLLGVVSCKKEVIEKPIVDPIEEPKLDESVPAVIPHIYIEVDGDEEVVSKDFYLSATVRIDGMSKFEDLTSTKTSIKARGNSTLNKPKKPYRLKLDKKASILGLPSAKNWVLLANYQDYSLMTNAVAMKIAKQLGMPFTHDIIPVDVTVNGVYRGSYTLTQQVEVNENRVNVGDDGVLLEMDTYFDEEFQFYSNHFFRDANTKEGLPVMVKDPDVESAAQFEKIKSEFLAFEELLVAPGFPNNNYGDFIDKKQLVNYLIVNNLAANFEIAHPKSVYMHKTNGGKYIMGPVWDFDWGFGIDEFTRVYFNFVNQPLIKPGDEKKGAQFFANFIDNDPEIRQLYVKQWNDYRKNGFEQLMSFIEEYAAKIRESKKKDFAAWESTYATEKVHANNNLPQTKANLKTYLRERAKYIDTYVQSLSKMK